MSLPCVLTFRLTALLHRPFLSSLPCPSSMPSRSHGLVMIEDCAQAHSASIHGESVGSFGDVAAWSFC